MLFLEIRSNSGSNSIEFTSKDTVLKNTSLLISPHGGALGNMIWCNKKTKIIEILPFDKLQERPCYFYLAKALGLEYFLFEPDIFDFYKKDIHINEKELIRFIQSDFSPKFNIITVFNYPNTENFNNMFKVWLNCVLKAKISEINKIKILTFGLNDKLIEYIKNINNSSVEICFTNGIKINNVSSKLMLARVSFTSSGSTLEIKKAFIGSLPFLSFTYLLNA